MQLCCHVGAPHTYCTFSGKGHSHKGSICASGYINLGSGQARAAQNVLNPSSRDHHWNPKKKHQTVRDSGELATVPSSISPLCSLLASHESNHSNILVTVSNPAGAKRDKSLTKAEG
eukprot:5898246-Amphidinium_carterae.1